MKPLDLLSICTATMNVHEVLYSYWSMDLGGHL